MEDFDPTLVEQAARALLDARRLRWDNVHQGECITDARAILTAVAPTLRAEGAAEWMKVAVMRDGQAIREAEQRGKVEGARQVFAEVEAMVAEWGQVVPPLDPPRAAVSVLDAAREAVARIEGGA